MMNETKLTKQEQRALLELECELARLKIKNSRRRTQMLAQSAPKSSLDALQIAQIANDTVINNPLWKIAMLYGRGKQKWLLGAGLLAWQIFANNKSK